MRATDPTKAAAQISRVPMGAGATPLAVAPSKPLPFPPHQPQVNVRSENMPVHNFSGSGPIPHVIHPNSNVGMPSSGAPFQLHVPGVK